MYTQVTCDAHLQRNQQISPVRWKADIVKRHKYPNQHYYHNHWQRQQQQLMKTENLSPPYLVFWLVSEIWHACDSRAIQVQFIVFMKYVFWIIPGSLPHASHMSTTNEQPSCYKRTWDPPPFVSVNKCRYGLDSRYGNFHVLSFDGPQLLYRLRITPSSTIYCFTLYMAPPSKRVIHRMPGVFVFLCAKRQLLQCLGEYCPGTKQFLG